MTFYAEHLAYVRTGDPDDPDTPHGVVQVDPGEPVPDDADPVHVDELVEAGVLLEGKPKAPTVKAILAEVGDDPLKARAALETEQAGDNRPTLVDGLKKVITAGTSSDAAGV